MYSTHLMSHNRVNRSPPKIPIVTICFYLVFASQKKQLSGGVLVLGALVKRAVSGAAKRCVEIAQAYRDQKKGGKTTENAACDCPDMILQTIILP